MFIFQELISLSKVHIHRFSTFQPFLSHDIFFNDLFFSVLIFIISSVFSVRFFQIHLIDMFIHCIWYKYSCTYSNNVLYYSFSEFNLYNYLSWDNTYLLLIYSRPKVKCFFSILILTNELYFNWSFINNKVYVDIFLFQEKLDSD